MYFQQAIDKDPSFGAAYSGLADSNSGLTWHGFSSPAETLPRAEAAALKAIEIDPESAEAHASLGSGAKPQVGLASSGSGIQACAPARPSLCKCTPLVWRFFVGTRAA